ncbi:lycopene cyclase family protein [Flavobacterium sp. SUN052]|uniref:lycopene cyclase family protein n=1 Tax=Flavobacterium sp. SUN052 TaxID=3002441 RepID=UPI00237E48C1|nr:lycopene cyclase family protein [Flavobacterium sp. SUN052]MEC4003405.1 lycopene cyclase family protein [Flavobacterium sp. SUN052]
MKHYDYIFTGSGLSALMTVYEMILSNNFDNKSILLIDDNPKKSNDRTWCFWDDSNLFDAIISKKWDNALYADENFRRNLKLQPYQYKMIRGLDFYNLVLDLISNQKNIHFLNQKVIDFDELENYCIVKTETENYTCNKIFNSIYNSELVKSQKKYPLLQQHFIGWFIKSKEEVFDKNTATFMDFSVEQKGNTRFMYVLPTSETEALLEYTLFSKDLLSRAEYETEIEKYIKKLGILEYEIVEKEQGNIPMTSYEFWKNNSKNIINIGSAGGWTKASTGFTFKNVTKYSKKLILFLQTQNDFTKFHKKDKFWLYDLLFIDVLYKNNKLGSKVFSSLFQKGNPTLIFKFLDGETTFLEDLKVMLKCPTIPFAKAFFKRLF